MFGLLKIYRSHLGILENTDTDELTGLSNRRPFDEAFRRLANSPPPKSRAHTRRNGAPIRRRRGAELAVVDIDFFKRINDSFGHPYGDEVLVLLARIMRNCFRDSDRMFRFGGEEFVIILAGRRSAAGGDRAGAVPFRRGDLRLSAGRPRHCQRRRNLDPIRGDRLGRVRARRRGALFRQEAGAQSNAPP